MIDKTSTTKREILVPTYTDGTHIATEYGCRFPDGRVEWGTWKDHSGGWWNYSVIIPTSGDPYNTTGVERWTKTLNRKAEEASIDREEYADGHTFVKRTVILVTTKPEEV